MVNTDILLYKLYRIGVRGSVKPWFHSYLSTRTQYVIVNNKESNIGNVTLGVPQGSIIGPLLFLIYISDMKKSFSLLEGVQYADDTTSYLSGKKSNSLCQNMNSQLQLIDHWLQLKKLSLNISKTYCILLTRSNLNTQNVCIRYVKLRRVDQTKFLGIVVDNKLGFEGHIYTLSKKLSSTIGAIKRVKIFLPESVVKNKSLFYSCLLYGICVWRSLGVGNFEGISNLQRKTFFTFFSHSNIYFLKTNSLLAFESIFLYNVPLKLHKYLNSSDFPEITSAKKTRFITRGNFNLPQCRSIKFKFFFYFQINRNLE